MAESTAGRRIVVVEDDPQIRGLVQTMLSAEGYSVAATGDPTQAVDLIKATQPDLVLCDIAMPVLDGYGVLKALQSDPATARFPVVFLTAHREFSERVRAFRYGVVDYLSKPFSKKILLRKIEKVLESLDRRAGVAALPPEAPVSELLEEVQRDARSGVLTVTNHDGEQSKLVISAGAVVENTGDQMPALAASAAFEELEAGREDIVAHDPERLPGSDAALPRFDKLAPMLRNVLVVDDNGEFRVFLAGLLRAQGFTVHEAADGDSGLRKALEERPWLIITDVRMPRADGFEFCRRVRSHSLIRQTPLLFLSGWDDYKQRYRGLELGADDFLSKTTPIRELLMRIQLILARYAGIGGRSAQAASGMQGHVQVIGAPGVLQMCHISRLTGVLSARDGARRAQIGFREGDVVYAEADARRGEEAVWEFLAWERGHFDFEPGADPGGRAPLGVSFDQLILEGCRRLDEKLRRSAPAPILPDDDDDTA